MTTTDGTPAYRAGVNFANQFLAEFNTTRAPIWRDDVAKDMAGLDPDSDNYRTARGFVDTLTDYIAERSDI